MSDATSFKGSCHCGFIKYEVKIPNESLKPPTALRCNCSFCQKPGFTSLFVPLDSIDLITPAFKSELSDYQANNNPNIHRYFCNKCGTHIFREGKFENDGQTFEFCTLNAVTLETPQEGLDFSKWKFEYFDGKYDDKREHGRGSIPWKDGVV